MLQMTLDVSEAVADSIGVWMPFYVATERDEGGGEHISLN